MVSIQRLVGPSRTVVAAVARRPAARPPTTTLFWATRQARRGYASEAEEPFNPDEVERATDEADVVIVGGGPAGLSAAIRLKQLANDAGNEEFRVIVLEKASEPGNHILSGAVLEPKALNELIPNWEELGAPLNQPALKDSMKFLTKGMSIPMPHPPQMSNHGNYIVSLSRVVAWLAEQAESLGVEVYPGFAGAKVLYTEDGKGIKGVVTGDVGLDKNFQPKDSYEPGMEFHAKVTLIAEGAHGSLSKEIQNKFNLREGKDPQTYGLGVKEVWKVKDENYEPGKIVHTMGWPLTAKTYGGSFLYHMEDNMVTLGLVVGLDYENPYISPFREFQRMKHHPEIAKVLEGGECIAYGARALNEGGLQSIPKLFFPGGALIGCSAGFLNVPKIKGTHNAMKTGMLAAEEAYKQITERGESESEEPIDMSGYEKAFENSWVYDELKEVRNLRPSFHNPLGIWGGMAYSGLDSMILKGRVPWTFHHPKEDYAATGKAANFQEIDYPKPDGKLSFDILTSVARTGTNHAENQPVHLRLPNTPGARAKHTEVNVTEYAGLLGRVCPAAVYEYQDAEGAEVDAVGKKFVINSQNCIHCKTCSIKTPTQDITWTVPEGGGGPKYTIT
ncbi:putative electron transfer flavoprotein-ubiquinone oxidoreductase, mitochondrial [Vanrija pseudolonga]|uniref:Electron transfer flavoprotein-ubiquinone oxidoreductase n=1 Tax=Vanrija pseudolonga TaxID=143232 RepID=A0AAF0Y9A0_9TREE|nr:putative electron transfer flavoprotein-ubiquinone oxidoreductase, mitochondrial [Vanrija pseudolonga]